VTLLCSKPALRFPSSFAHATSTPHHHCSLARNMSQCPGVVVTGMEAVKVKKKRRKKGSYFVTRVPRGWGEVPFGVHYKWVTSLQMHRCNIATQRLVLYHSRWCTNEHVKMETDWHSVTMVFFSRIGGWVVLRSLGVTSQRKGCLLTWSRSSVCLKAAW
jgi:hypothetical protein